MSLSHSQKHPLKKPEGRILALDYGEKRIGIAISDDTHTLAFPLEKLLNTSQFLTKLKDYIAEYNVHLLVLGLPKTLKGEDSLKTKEVRKFHTFLIEQLQIPIEFEDERLSTVLAFKQLQQIGIKEKKQKEKIDSHAATIFLQTFLNRLNNAH